VITLEVKQDEATQIMVQGEGGYQVLRTRNPKGIAVMIEGGALLCPGCGDRIESGDSTDCSCYHQGGER
jgi:hypothetical protein